ncbi:DinB family protein [Aneurinibacillus uraniidurans]|uniref:DinB family protein n=1 Tax=Aneurinibacillus uraniidurans TaxID=2966586 RepID=UPI00234B3F9C|nr:DinB family protein [Aneurinibacillus sp. B1]WCN37640.1 DinB family protein [Aneurinibacillus sp. B1]
MIHNVEEFVEFLGGLRKRTMNYVKAVPNSILEWKPAEDKFSTGDILRHLASSELMFLSVFEHGKWSYPGHESSKGETIEEIIPYMEACHTRLMEGLLSLGNDLLEKKVPTLHGHEVSSWRIMMALTEHEIHHRGQLSTYLQMNGIEPPQIFGLKIEQVER